MDTLRAVCSFLRQFFPAVAGTLFYIYLATHSAVNKPHSTEALKYIQAAGLLAAYKVCCAVCTLLCAGHCARCLCCLLFLCCLDFSFSNGHVRDSFGEINKTRTSTSIPCPTYDNVRSLPRKNPGREGFAVLYRVADFIAFGSRCLCRA